MLGSINLTHTFLTLHLSRCYLALHLLPQVRILLSLEPIEKVVAKSFIEIDLKAGYDFHYQRIGSGGFLRLAGLLMAFR